MSSSSLLFHEFYGQGVERPVHMLMDLGLGERRMSSKAYVSKPLTLGGNTLGTSFEECKLTVVTAEADKIGMETLVKTSLSGLGGAAAISEADSMEVRLFLCLLIDQISMSLLCNTTHGPAHFRPSWFWGVSGAASGSTVSPNPGLKRNHALLYHRGAGQFRSMDRL